MLRMPALCFVSLKKGFDLFHMIARQLVAVLIVLPEHAHILFKRLQGALRAEQHGVFRFPLHKLVAQTQGSL